MTGADSAEMGQGGMRVNMVPRDGGNAFRGSVVGNYAGESLASDNCGSPGIGQACTRSNLTGSMTFNPNNTLTNVDVIQKIWDVNPIDRRPDRARTRSGSTTRSGTGASNKTKADSLLRHRTRRRSSTTPDFTQPGHRRRPHRQQRGPHLVAGQRQGQDLRLPRRPEQVPRPLGHRGERFRPRPPAIQVTPTSFVSRVEVDAHAHQQAAVRSRLRRLQPGIHRALSAGGDWSPGSTQPLVHAVYDSVAPNKTNANAWNNPGRSLLEAVHRAVRRVVRHRLALACGSAPPSARRLAAARSSRPATCSRSPTTPAGPTVGHAAPPDRSPQRRSSPTSASSCRTVDDGPRHAQPRPALRLVHQRDRSGERCLPSTLQRRRHVTAECPDGKNNLDPGCVGTRRRTGRTSPRASASSLGPVRQRPDRAQGELRALRRRPGLAAGTSPTTTTRSDCRPAPTRAPGATSTATARRSTPPATSSSTS